MTIGLSESEVALQLSLSALKVGLALLGMLMLHFR